MFPNPREPLLGIWIKEQVEALSNQYSINVVSPKPFVPPVFVRWRKIRRIPKIKSIGRITVHYPRFMSFPFGLLTILTSLSCFFFLSYYLLLKIHLKKVVLIDAHAILPDGFVAVLLAGIFNKPVVVTIHGSDFYTNVRKFVNRWMMKFTLRKCSLVICVSERLKNLAKEIYSKPNEQKFVVISTGFDERKFKPIPMKIARQQLGIPLNEKIILYAGSIIKVKGLVYLVKAIKMLLNKGIEVKCYILGTGKLEYSLNQMVKEMGTHKNIFFMGQVDHDDVPSWMSACNLLVLPSLNEGLPTVVLEAFACGKPVVTTNVGGLPEVVMNGKNGLLTYPRNSEDLADKLLEALNKQWNKEQIVAYAKRYSWKATTKKLKNAYKSVNVSQ